MAHVSRWVDGVAFWGPCDIENPSAGHTNPSFSVCRGKGTEHEKTAFRIDGVRIPIFNVPLLDVFWALEGLQVGPGRALGRARRREERTLVLIWQGIARMDAGVDVGSAKWPQNRAQGPPPKKNVSRNQNQIVFLKSSKTNRKIAKLSLFRAFKTGFRTNFLGLFLSFVSARSFLHFFQL